MKDRPVMEIPGFYYDKEKKKYFKVQTAAEAPRPDSKYSVANIKKEEKLEKAFKKRKQIKRRDFHSSLLGPELGLLTRRPLILESWATACARVFSPYPLLSSQSTRLFARDPATNRLWVANDDCTVKCHEPWDLPERGRREDNAKRRRLYCADESDISTPFPYYYRPAAMTHYVMNGPISTLNYLPASGTLVVSTLGSDRAPVIHVSRPEHDGPGIAELFTIMNQSIWAADPLPIFSTRTLNSIPPTDTECIAFGMSTGFIILQGDPTGSMHEQNNPELATNIEALSWLSPHSLALGSRDGKIHIHDTRARGTTHILTHSTPVKQLRRTDDFTRVVCAGIDDTLVLYDMRMSRTSTKASLEHMSKSSRKKSRYRSTPNQSSVSLFAFPWSNSDYPDLGLDSHPHLGLLAGADEHGKISVWSLRTGHVVKTWEPHQPNQGGERGRCVRFEEEDGGIGDVSVWGTVGREVTRFGW
ncbi:hypothetical protein GQ43DRAFT_484333 [Delitschia confertaspora ATCC 74209]|uniref:WD40 repeat-like protein n=1 Tax=Delitschia confertaspora ATCC 74209 TaxID=1513339 RepID=A0A9P4JIN0_9PLEO|nr:hypothetical protein GQ43DRAFT_484333 [Delitschia confertaspora ATCC 74209]